jgi:hypothetical protein
MPSRLTVVLLSLLLTLPVVIFWLWLVIVPSRVAVLCPEECLCETQKRSLQCEGTPLTAVPIIQLKAVQEIWFFRNRIAIFVNESFSLTELEIFFVDHCGLKTIHLGALKGLTRLTLHDIQNNEICEILPARFENMISVRHTFLRDTVDHLDRDTSSGMFKLVHKDSSGHKLQYLPLDAFLMLPKPHKMNLYQYYDVRTPPGNRKSLDLSHLDTSHCNVSSVSDEIFANMRDYETHILSLNNLWTVDINVLRALPKLSIFVLYDNPVQCECQVKELRRWSEERNIEAVIGRRAMICDKAKEIKGVGRWIEIGQCLEDNIQLYGDHNNTRYNYANNVYDYDINFLNQFEVPVYAVLFIFGTTGNVIILIIILCNKDMQTLPNIYILNLAIGNIIYLMQLFAEAYENLIYDTWLRNELLFTYLPFCRRWSVCLSAYSVALLSIQRYSVIVNPFHVILSSKPTWGRTLATIFGLWIVAVLFAFPSAVSSYLCALDATMKLTEYYGRVVIFELLAFCVIPLCVIAFTYIMSARHLVENSSSVPQGTENPQLKTRRTTAKIVLGLTVVFLISYLPYHVLLTCIIWTQHIENTYPSIRVIIMYLNYGMLNQISKFLLSINSCLNPVVLFCTSSPIRQHFKRYLTYFCKTNSPSTNL